MLYIQSPELQCFALHIFFIQRFKRTCCEGQPNCTVSVYCYLMTLYYTYIDTSAYTAAAKSDFHRLFKSRSLQDLPAPYHAGISVAHFCCAVVGG